ncbi:MAG: zinc ribbon domain-containing protein [Clostridiales bacterium]|nr:zinc ribbon domain-containing protein [Clostridiales bacterium]
MFCTKCGSEMPDNSKFCTKCGATLTRGIPQQKKQMSGKNIGILLTAAVAVVAVVAGFLIFGGGNGGTSSSGNWGGINDSITLNDLGDLDDILPVNPNNGGGANKLPTSTPTPVPQTKTYEVREDTTINMVRGQTIQLKCTYNEFGSDYHTYEWSCTGSGLKLEKTGNKTCIVTANAAGTYTINMKYSYTKDEPDVLTGISRPQFKAKKRTYTIVVK